MAIGRINALSVPQNPSQSLPESSAYVLINFKFLHLRKKARKKTLGLFFSLLPANMFLISYAKEGSVTTIKVKGSEERNSGLKLQARNLFSFGK